MALRRAPRISIPRQTPPVEKCLSYTHWVGLIFNELTQCTCSFETVNATKNSELNLEIEINPT